MYGRPDTRTKFWWRKLKESVCCGNGENVRITLRCVFGKWVLRMGGRWNN